MHGVQRNTTVDFHLLTEHQKFFLPFQTVTFGARLVHQYDDEELEFSVRV